MVIRTEDEFNALEEEWRERLVGRSLVIEANVGPDEALEALGVLGENLMRRSGRVRENLYARYPAVLATGLCAIGSTHYDAGAFWPNVPLALRLDANRQQETGRAFQKALHKLGLSRFTTPYTYVGEILMHAGVPASSVGDLIHTIVRWDDGHTSGDAPGFIRWVSSMSQAVATTRGFDVPTYRFLTEGGEVAEDFVERLLVAIDAGEATTDLPKSLTAAVQAALEEVERRPKRTKRRSADTVPALTYDPNFGVRVRLPALEAQIEDAVSWTVVTGGEVSNLAVEAPWPGDPVEPKWISVRSPQQAVDVEVFPGAQRWELSLLDSKNPLLVFEDATRVLVPEKTALPKDVVWLGFPADEVEQPETLLEYEGELIVTERGGTPYGWSGWAFIAVDVTKTEKLRLAERSERWRYVSTVDRPRLVGSAEAIPFLSTIDGAPIRSERPKLFLPGPKNGVGSIDWTVTVSDSHGEEIVRTSKRVNDVEETIDIWDEGEVLLGQFTISVRGPLGRGATLSAAIAEGFIVTSSTSFRWIDQAGSGLEPGVVTIHNSASAEPLEVQLGGTAKAAKLRLVRGAQQLSAICEIPYMTVGFATKVAASAKIVPLLVNIEGLPNAVLRVRVPSGSRKVFASAVHNGEVLQTIEGKGGWGSAIRTLNLSALADTLATKPSAELRLVVDDTSAPIAYIRPRRLGSAVSVDSSGVMSISDKADIPGLVAYIYPEFARWRKPYRVVVPESHFEVHLESEILREGRAVVILTVDNPWIPEEPPPRPDRTNVNAFDVKLGTLGDTADPAERGFRPWLAGLTPTCPSAVESLPVALQLYSLLRLEESPEVADRMRTAIGESVRIQRTNLLTAILQSDADLGDLMRLLVEADVVTVPREQWESSEKLWSLAPGLGVLADTDELGGEGEPDLRFHLENTIGKEALLILDHGEDPASKVGRFSEQTNILLKMPPEQLEAIIREAGIVPKALLDKDSRTSASFQLLKARHHPAIAELCGLSARVLEVAKAAIAGDFGQEALLPIAAREVTSKSGLGVLPALSLALSLVARASSRGKPLSAKVYDYIREGYVKLASSAPKIVHQDIALAELWITRWEELA